MASLNSGLRFCASATSRGYPEKHPDQDRRPATRATLADMTKHLLDERPIPLRPDAAALRERNVRAITRACIATRADRNGPTLYDRP